ncbi:MAG: hypothetical protein KDD55_10765, partial [Bdellovibrionales bacterium]|nr:hypothetical protein [Bdellovibrionales bacterium]
MLHRLNPLQIPSYLSIALLCCIASFLTPHGTITIDEGAYYLATKAFTDSGSLSLQNGLTKSIGFEIIGAKPIVEYVGEHLYSQYPPGHAILSSPLYALFGLSGLFLVNGIATALILILTFLIAQNIYSSKREGYIASALALVACPSLLYASSVWPHALSSSLILLTYFILFHRQNNPFSPLVSGLVAGVALLIRLDSAIPLFALDISLLLATPLRINLKRLSLFTLGSLPALLALCILNSYKYGFFSPLVYGVDGHGSLLRSLPFLVVTITALTILLFFFHWLSRREITLSDKASLLGVLAALLLAILTTPESLKKL